MKINLTIDISEDSVTDDVKAMLLNKLKKKKMQQIMEDGPFPFRGTGLSATVSPGVTPFNFPFLDDD